MTALPAIGENRAPADWDDIEPRDQGFSIFDGELKLVTCNHAFVELFDLPEKLSRPGTPLTDLLRFYASRGDYGPGNIEDIVRARLDFIGSKTFHVFNQLRPGGQVLEVRSVRTLEGGLVNTFSDVTERERARERVDFQARVINQIQEAVVVCDIDGIITFWNEGARALWGYEAAEVVSRHNEVLYFENMAHTPERELISQIERDGNFIHERRFRRKDGVPFWGRLSLSTMDGTDDDAVAMIACIQDISQYRAAREDRERSEAHLRATLNTVVDGIATIDDQGRILSFNAAAERIFGYLAAEVIGNNVTMLMRETDAAAHDGLMRNYSETGVANIIGVGREVRGRRSDGTVFPLELAISEMRLGGQNLFAGVMRDITARKETERILNRQAKALATLSEGVVIADLKFEIVDCNPAVERTFGYSKAELLHRPVHVLVADPEAWKRQLDSVWATVMTEGEHFTPIEYRRKDGSTFTGERLLTLLLDESGKRAGLVGILRDTTARIRTEEMLRQAQKMEAIGQLTGGIAHDFNNLLTIIQINLELAAEEFKNGADVAKRIDEALHASIRGAGLVQRLLAFSRKQKLAPIRADVRDVITGMDALLRSSLGSPIDIETVFTRQLWLTRVDPAQLEIALLNLAINARDAMPEGGTLTIETANVVIDDDMVARHPFMVPGAFITIVIADSGVGMPPEVVSQVFEPFFTTKDVGKGSGLGLSMVYGFVKQSGGYVTIDSDVNTGTAVTIYLPRI